eukprot:7727-Heterococcus_DN1.PRE.2
MKHILYNQAAFPALSCRLVRIGSLQFTVYNSVREQASSYVCRSAEALAIVIIKRKSTQDPAKHTSKALRHFEKMYSVQ